MKGNIDVATPMSIFEYCSERACLLGNDATAMRAGLDGSTVGVKLALEPTSRVP